MIDYLSLQEIRQMFNSLERFSDNEFNNIDVATFQVKIYAGAQGLCVPQRFLGRLNSYQSVQVGISEKVKEEVRLIKPLNDERFANFAWAQYFYYHGHNKKIIPSYMATYVPLEQVSIMIREIYKVSRLKMFF